MTAVFIWLSRECCAEFYGTKALSKDVSEFHIEGHNIPKGNRHFTLWVEEIVPNVLIIDFE